MIQTMQNLEEAILSATAVRGYESCGEGVVYVQFGDTINSHWVPIHSPVPEWPAQFREMLSQAIVDDKQQNFIVVYKQPTGLHVVAFPRADILAAHQVYKGALQSAVEEPIGIQEDVN